MGYTPPPPSIRAQSCAWCEQPDPVRDSRGRCRNCGAPAPARAPLLPIPGLTLPPVQVGRRTGTLNPGTR
jgi:hypothetical protein